MRANTGFLLGRWGLPVVSNEKDCIQLPQHTEPKTEASFPSKSLSKLCKLSNSKPRDRATISLRSLTQGSGNCCNSKACDGHEGSFYLAELLPAQFFWFLFASWTIYLEETQTHTATFRRPIVNARVHSQISPKLFLGEGFHPNSFFLYKQPNSQSQELASWVRSGM